MPKQTDESKRMTKARKLMDDRAPKAVPAPAVPETTSNAAIAAELFDAYQRQMPKVQVPASEERISQMERLHEAYIRR